MDTVFEKNNGKTCKWIGYVDYVAVPNLEPIISRTNFFEASLLLLPYVDVNRPEFLECRKPAMLRRNFPLNKTACKQRATRFLQYIWNFTCMMCFLVPPSMFLHWRVSMYLMSSNLIRLETLKPHLVPCRPHPLLPEGLGRRKLLENLPWHVPSELKRERKRYASHHQFSFSGI